MEITIKWTVDSKSDEEAKKKVKSILNAAYGDLAAPLPDWDPEALWAELHKTKERYLQAEMDLQNRDDEIQDLKLENDRLMQQNELMVYYIHALACTESKKSKFYGMCETCNCPYYDYSKGFGKGACKLESRELIGKEAANIIDKLEEL